VTEQPAKQPQTKATGPQTKQSQTKLAEPHVLQPKREIRQVGNKTISIDSLHRVRDIRSAKMNIHRGLSGGRQVESTLRGYKRVVINENGRGFYERPYLKRSGRTYIQRTYVVGGHSYASVYRTYSYGGVTYYRYVPAYYYRPAFYGWAYNPWPAPVRYSWGWGAEPWYGYYGYYFAPAPVYPSAALWLTDFLLAENLRLGFEDTHRDGRSNVTDSVPASSAENSEASLSPEVKQAIAGEVEQQLVADQEAAQSSSQISNDSEVPSALDPKWRIFVVFRNLDVVVDGGQECALTPDDIVLRTGNEMLEGNKVEVSVQSSKKGDCPMGANTQMDLAELQEMHNRFRQTTYVGLQQLAADQGKGLPTPPDTTTLGSEVPPAVPDANAASEIQKQQKEADKTEQDVVRHTASGTPGGGN
jgi:hypothetical protein